MSRNNRLPKTKHVASLNGNDGATDSIEAVVHAVQYSSYAGPLPHPETLKAFEELLPGSAERIFRQFEEQSEHRRLVESQVVRSATFTQRLGSMSASFIGLIGVSGGIWLAHEGKSLEGLSALVATLVSLVGTYLYQKRMENNETPPSTQKR